MFLLLSRCCLTPVLFYQKCIKNTRACLKNAFCKMSVTICGRFCLNEGGAAGCVNRMKAKYHAKWGMQIAGMIFQTRSSQMFFRMPSLSMEKPSTIHTITRPGASTHQGADCKYP